MTVDTKRDDNDIIELHTPEPASFTQPQDQEELLKRFDNGNGKANCTEEELQWLQTYSESTR